MLTMREKKTLTFDNLLFCLLYLWHVVISCLSYF